METFIKVKYTKEERKEQADIYTKMEISSKGDGKMTKKKGKANILQNNWKTKD